MPTLACGASVRLASASSRSLPGEQDRPMVASSKPPARAWIQHIKSDEKVLSVDLSNVLNDKRNKLIALRGLGELTRKVYQRCV